jgi:hypothetical protein
VERSDAFQSITVVRPIFELCESLEEVTINDESVGPLETVLEFIEESFARFMKSPYAVFDGAATLVPPSEGVNTLSCILVTLVRQWQYAKENETDSDKFNVITKWFLDFLLRSALIGENSTALLALVDSLNTTVQPNAERRGPVLADCFRLREDIDSWTSISFASQISYHEPPLGTRYECKSTRC